MQWLRRCSLRNSESKASGNKRSWGSVILMLTWSNSVQKEFIWRYSDAYLIKFSPERVHLEIFWRLLDQIQSRKSSSAVILTLTWSNSVQKEFICSYSDAYLIKFSPERVHLELFWRLLDQIQSRKSSSGVILTLTWSNSVQKEFICSYSDAYLIKFSPERVHLELFWRLLDQIQSRKSSSAVILTLTWSNSVQKEFIWRYSDAYLIKFSPERVHLQLFWRLLDQIQSKKSSSAVILTLTWSNSVQKEFIWSYSDAYLIKFSPERVHLQLFWRLLDQIQSRKSSSAVILTLTWSNSVQKEFIWSYSDAYLIKFSPERVHLELFWRLIKFSPERVHLQLFWRLLDQIQSRKSSSAVILTLTWSNSVQKEFICSYSDAYLIKFSPERVHLELFWRLLDQIQSRKSSSGVILTLTWSNSVQKEFIWSYSDAYLIKFSPERVHLELFWRLLDQIQSRKSSSGVILTLTWSNSVQKEFIWSYSDAYLIKFSPERVHLEIFWRLLDQIQSRKSSSAVILTLTWSNSVQKEFICSYSDAYLIKFSPERVHLELFWRLLDQIQSRKSSSAVILTLTWSNSVQKEFICSYSDAYLIKFSPERVHLEIFWRLLDQIQSRKSSSGVILTLTWSNSVQKEFICSYSDAYLIKFSPERVHLQLFWRLLDQIQSRKSSSELFWRLLDQIQSRKSSSGDILTLYLIKFSPERVHLQLFWRLLDQIQSRKSSSGVILTLTWSNSVQKEFIWRYSDAYLIKFSPERVHLQLFWRLLDQIQSRKSSSGVILTLTWSNSVQKEFIWRYSDAYLIKFSPERVHLEIFWRLLDQIQSRKSSSGVILTLTWSNSVQIWRRKVK